MKKIYLTLLFLLQGLLLQSPGADRISSSSTHTHVSVALLSETESIQPGKTFWVALHFKMDKDWHIYWKNPGDSGLPVRIKWDLPEGLHAGDISWPTPLRIETEGIVNFVYFNEVSLLVPITPSPEIKFQEVLLKAQTDWLVCKESCIPGKALLELSLPVKKSPPGLNAENIKKFEQARIQIPANETNSSKQMPPLGFWTAVLFSFIGGLILNLMPCVLPVLSIKILGFIKRSGGNRKESILHGLFFGLGVLVSFWFLAGLLLALRAFGHELGWGFQLQSSAFVLFMALLFLLLSLNLFGVFEFGSFLTGTAANVADISDLRGSFLSGILATAVATPCTAPFMGTALGFALIQSPAVSFVIFTALAAGMAFPYVAFTAFPGSLKFLPKPGYWMEVLKKILGIPLLLTALWLGGVFVSQHTSKDSLQQLQPKESLTWEPYSGNRLTELLASGNSVFIDFTADWCLSCKVNELMALKSAKVISKFKELKITALKADWTSGNTEITKALNGYGRSGVPLYVFYGNNQKNEPVILPEVITPNIVLEYIEQNQTKKQKGTKP